MSELFESLINNIKMREFCEEDLLLLSHDLVHIKVDTCSAQNAS